MITNVIYAVLVLGVIAVVFGLILSVAAKAFEVKVDERLPKIQACLAGANCGGCGYPGCAGCAEAILAGKAPVTACAPASVRALSRVDLPTLVYPTMATVGTPSLRLRARWRRGRCQDR